MAKAVLTSLIHLAQRYDVFFVDQFGVLRDDTQAYQGAIDALSRLASFGKRIVILSNSGRSGEYNAERLTKLGFAAQSFEFFVTSGDVAYEILSGSRAALGSDPASLTISSGGDTNLADRLKLRSVKNASEADVIFISGSEAERIPLDEYRELLRPAAKRGIPCFCTNPDMHKLHAGSVAPGAGSIAKAYEAMGGPVTWLGKPYPEIYEHALQVTDVKDRRQVICIGDSIEHDILGAKAAGLHSVLVRTGILAEADDGELDRISMQFRAFPNFILPKFAFDGQFS